MDTSPTENATESTERKPEGDRAGEAVNGAQEQPRPHDGGNSEAAKYRRRLREAEAANAEFTQQLETLQQQLTGLQRAEVERIAGQQLQAGADLWRHDDVTLDSMLGEDGRVDPTKVADAAKNVLAAHPHWRRHAPATEPSSSVTANGRIGDGNSRSAFADAFAPRNTRRG